MATNDVELCGQVKDELKYGFAYNDGKTFYAFTIGVKRSSGTEDEIKCYIEDSLLNENPWFGKDTFVRVCGRYTSYNKISKTTGKSRLILQLHVLDIAQLFEEKYINKITLEGYACKDPIYRTTPLGKNICEVIVAVNREGTKYTDYLPVIIWDKAIPYVKNWLALGCHFKVVGRIQSRIYTKQIDDKTSETRTAYEISTLRIEQVKDEDVENK